MAAAHGDVLAALVGLVGWSRLYAQTDTILAFFQCDALELLLRNVLGARATNDTVYDHLTTFLTNCLSVERDGKASSNSSSNSSNNNSTSSHEIAVATIAAVRRMSDVLHAEASDGGDGGVDENENENADADDVASLANVAKYLSKLIVNYRLSLNGVKAGSALAEDVLNIEAALAKAAAQDSGVKGTTIRDSFQRRDIRSDALTMYRIAYAKSRNSWRIAARR